LVAVRRLWTEDVSMKADHFELDEASCLRSRCNARIRHV
jgi:hypothetical protein